MPSTIVIIGSGIIGISTAYYLSLNDDEHTVHLVDAAPVLFEGVASGKAGGFLAKDWFSLPVLRLGELSFDLHRKLAEEFGGRDEWGWSWSLGFGSSSLDGGGGELGPWIFNGQARSRVVGVKGTSELHESEGPSWLKPSNGVYLLSERGTNAQVDPLRLCRFLLQKCISRRNVHVHNPATASILMKPDKQSIDHIRIQYQDSPNMMDVPCNSLIVTSGPWTTSVLSTLFPNQPLSSFPQIASLSGHSVVLRSRYWPKHDRDPYICHAFFANESGFGFSPVAFSRVGGDVYVGGVNDPGIPTPVSSASPPEPHPSCIDRLIEAGRKICRDDDIEVVRAGLCFRPTTRDGNPIIGRVEVENSGGIEVWVGAGHGPWGITLSLGTGMVLSQMVLGLPPMVDVSELAPR